MLQDEPRNQDAEDREDPISGMPEEGSRVENRLSLINVVQHNAVIITGREVKRVRPETGKSDSQRWL